MNATGPAPAPAGASISLPQPYLLFVGDAPEAGYVKTAFGLRDWASERVIGEFASSPDAVTLGLPRLRPAEAHARGARALVIGIANLGGHIDESWTPSLVEALEAGLDIISGLHSRLASDPTLKATAERLGRRLIDVRTPPPGIPCATGQKRSGRRLLTVGSDCALGKKYTALALARAFQGRGLDVDFRATGQTGIMIAGGGIPMDAVVADFAAGAAEILSPDASPGHWDVIEGQGSLFHPSYAGVSLALLHGSQPDVVVACHAWGRTGLIGHAGFDTPSIEDTIGLNLELGRLTNPAIRCAGVSLNTAGLSDSDAAAVLASESARLGLPVADPVRGGESFERLVDACLPAPAGSDR
jgi:uncharacterized NAD-dependent epimerase/dehydratase family protein